MKKLLPYIYLTFSAAAVFAQSPMSVDGYRREVLDYSFQLKQSSEQTEAVKQAMREAKTSFLPKLEFSGNAQYRITDYDMEIMGAALPMRGETYSLNVDLTQVVYGGGAVKHGYQAAKIQHNIASDSEELTATNVVYSANLNYWSTAAKRALYRLTSKYVEIIDTLESVVVERFREGLISKTDLLQIQSRLSEAKIQKSEAYKSYQLALQNFNIMMGRDPMTPVEMSDEIDREDKIPSSPMPLEEVLDRRAEYRIAGMQTDYQTSRMKIDRSKYLPTFAIGMKEGWGTQMLNFDGSNRFDTYAYASLKIPIFSWGAKYRNVASNRALIRASEYDILQTRDRISQELAAAYTSLVECRNQISIAEQSCEISLESLDLNTFSYNEGKLPIIDVLSAQVAWVQSNSSLIQAWLQEKVAFADYNKSIGNMEY